MNLTKAKILIIDDEPLSIGILKLLLKKAGYETIHSATNPEEGIKLYAELIPDLVLLDLNMPVISGFDVLKQLKKNERRGYLPVMVLSADTDDSSRLKALELGARDFLTKPYNDIEVITRIKNMLEVRMLQQKLRDQNMILEERVKQRTFELRVSQLEVVQRLGLASEYRDQETGQHILRMSYYSECLARKLGLNKKQCELILNSSPLHDIGKIGIPDDILLKKGKLTKEEFEIMKTHTTIGANMLTDSKSELMDTARQVALSHHEKWNGAGYPKGLKGNEIHQYGRIVALCDVFDALTSARPYKKAWSVEDALTEIKGLAGTHFDPELVPCFLQIMPEILEIMARYTDVPESEPNLFAVN